MSNITPEQKAVLVELATRYSPPVRDLLMRGADDQVLVNSRAEAAMLDEFANNICSHVVRDHPNHAGSDEEVNANAELSVHLIANILHEHGYAID